MFKNRKQIQFTRHFTVLKRPSLLPPPPRMFQSMQEEFHWAQKQNTDILSRLQAADTGKHSLQEKLVELDKLNTQLQVSPPSHDPVVT